MLVTAFIPEFPAFPERLALPGTGVAPKKRQLFLLDAVLMSSVEERRFP
jgi:hypothetical protein